MKIKVLIVEDSIVAKELLSYILNSDSDIEVIGYASNGQRALSFLENNKPDLITMDINMPGMNGYQTTKEILKKYPIPILVISAILDPNDMKSTFNAMQAGALAVVEKPHGIGHSKFNDNSKYIIKQVKMLSEIKVVRRKYTQTQVLRRVNKKINSSNNIQIVAIGISTGGPKVIQEIVLNIKSSFSKPILITQHISEGFAESYVSWLKEVSNLPVKLAENGETLLDGHIYVAPSTLSLTVSANKRVCLKAPKQNSNKPIPSVSEMFLSVDKIYRQNALGILLTGMGRDGAKELKIMRDNGATTIAQDEESSTIFGMPKVAIELGGAELVMNPTKIIEYLNKLN